MNDIFLRACRGEPTERTPLWMMRQAGRYLPEYRAVRERHDFVTVCRTPELACRVTLQPIDRFAFDAAILFSDIMMPVESMGVTLGFNPGPFVQDPLRDAAAVQRLRVPEADEIAPYAIETVRMLVRELQGRVPLIGFAGGPLTVAAYLVEGKGSKDFSHLRSLFYRAEDVARSLLDRLAELTGRYLRRQIEAGAHAVQLFDTWAGVLGERGYRRFVLPAVQKVFAALSDLDVPKIYFAQDAVAQLGAMTEIGVHVIGVDWRTEISDARAVVGPEVTLQGNLDPAVLRADDATIAREVERVLRSGGGRRHVFNLGHGVLPDTPLQGVDTLVQSVHRLSQAKDKG